MKNVIAYTLLSAALLCSSQVFAQTTIFRRETLSALDFTYFQGTQQYLPNFGMVEGASTTPPLTGYASVTIPDGSLVTQFMVCGGDNANDQEFSANLKRRSISTASTLFSAPQLMAHVGSGVTFASGATTCRSASVSSTIGTIDNAHWAYYVELTIGNTVEVIAAKVVYSCTEGGSC